MVTIGQLDWTSSSRPDSLAHAAADLLGVLQPATKRLECSRFREVASMPALRHGLDQPSRPKQCQVLHDAPAGHALRQGCQLGSRQAWFAGDHGEQTAARRIGHCAENLVQPTVGRIHVVTEWSHEEVAGVKWRSMSGAEGLDYAMGAVPLAVQ